MLSVVGINGGPFATLIRLPWLVRFQHLLPLAINGSVLAESFLCYNEPNISYGTLPVKAVNLIRRHNV